MRKFRERASGNSHENEPARRLGGSGVTHSPHGYRRLHIPQIVSLSLACSLWACEQASMTLANDGLNLKEDWAPLMDNSH